MKYRVSNVEAFRKWEADDDGDTERLVADIRGVSEPSQAMLAGTAFHEVLEKLAAPGDKIGEMGAGGFRFVFPIDCEIALTSIRELRASKTYIVDGEPIVISGQVDAIEGLRIEDHKTTARFDPDRYLEGYQWRLYLSIFAAKEFRWNIFELKEVASTLPTEGFALPPIEYEVTAQHTLTQYVYPNLEEDCQRLVERFAKFVRQYVEEPANA